MLTTPGIRAVWQQVKPPSLPAQTRRFMSAFFEAAGDPDVMAAEQAFITRQSLLRSWSEFQEHQALIVAPIATDIPSKAGTDLDEGRVAEDLTTMRMAMAVNALGLPAVALPSRHPRRSSSSGAADRPAVPRGPTPRCRGGPPRRRSASSRRSIPGSRCCTQPCEARKEHSQ